MPTGIQSQIATGDYLTLLTIQLQNQDPIDPVKQDDFVAQLSQFSMLEGIEGLNTSFESMLKLQEVSQGLDLVGKTIEYLDTGTGELRTGSVEKFSVNQGNIELLVNGQTVSIDNVAGVSSPT